MYSIPFPDDLNKDTSLTTEGTSPLVLSSIGEIIYPATIKTSSSVKEPGVVTVDILHKCWKKMVLPVYVITV